MNETVTIRPMCSAEAAEAARLEAACFPDPWSEKALLSQMEDSHSLYLAAECGGRLVGYLGTQMVLDEGDILRVAVEEEMRGQQIGTRLFQYLLQETPHIVMWNLDVRESNVPAIGLYKKIGFRTIGKRKRYYRHPEEDAILMQRKEGELTDA